MRIVALLFVSSGFGILLWGQQAASINLHTTPATKNDMSPDLKTLHRPVSEANQVREMYRPGPVPLPKRERGAAAERVLEHAPPPPFELEAVEIDSFSGIAVGQAGLSGVPPDTNGSVGRTAYVQSVNDAFAVFAKDTHQMLSGYIDGSGFTLAPFDARSLWNGFGGGCELANHGDPIVLFDKVADRWLVSQLGMPAGGPYSECIAISATADATSRYYRYEFQFQKAPDFKASAFNDYPKFGVWPDGYYATFNMFDKPVNGSSQGARLCSFERDKMLVGQPASMQCAQMPASIGGVLPADLDGSTLPPPHSPAYFLNFGDQVLRLWRLHIDWTNDKNSTLSNPPQLLKTASFDYFCTSETSKRPKPCVVQPGTNEKLDSLSDRLMYRLAYRNFEDHESLVVNHTVKAGNSSGIRWYEIRTSPGEPSVYQSGTLAPDAAFRWMGSIAMDKAGGILLGYSVSDNTTFPSIRFAGRSSGDPKWALSVEKELQSGHGSQPADRWGDYSSMSVDPADDCTFWFTSQIQPSTAVKNWETIISRLRIASCH